MKMLILEIYERDLTQWAAYMDVPHPFPYWKTLESEGLWVLEGQITETGLTVNVDLHGVKSTNLR